MADRPRKDVKWRGNSQTRARGWPKAVKLKLGNELTRVQLGANPVHGESLNDIGAGAQCIRIAENKEAYRVVYVASLGEYVYVLHAFHKKSKKGIATPKEEKDIAKKRYKELCREIAGAHKAPRRQQ